MDEERFPYRRFPYRWSEVPYIDGDDPEAERLFQMVFEKASEFGYQMAMRGLPETLPTEISELRLMYTNWFDEGFTSGAEDALIEKQGPLAEEPED